MLTKHAELDLGHCSELELKSAKSAAQFWKFGVVLKFFCGWVGIILESIACFYLYKARRTIRKPILIWLLILVWPVWFTFEFIRGIAMQMLMPRGNPVEHALVLMSVGMLSTIFQMITAFFVRNGIFHEWLAYLDDEDTRRCIRWWERMFLFIQFPAMMIYVWGLTLWYVEGWSIEDFRNFQFTFDPTQIMDLSIVALPFVLGFFGMLVNIVFEYKVLARFESRLWAPLLELRKQRTAPPSPQPAGPAPSV